MSLIWIAGQHTKILKTFEFAQKYIRPGLAWSNICCMHGNFELACFYKMQVISYVERNSTFYVYSNIKFFPSLKLLRIMHSYSTIFEMQIFIVTFRIKWKFHKKKPT